MLFLHLQYHQHHLFTHVDSFTVSLHNPNGGHLPLGLFKELSLAPEKTADISIGYVIASRTYELSEKTHVTPFCMYRFHSTGLCNYKP